MEELLQQKNYYCKPNSGLKMNCKLISGLINKNCNLFLGRYSNKMKLCAPKPARTQSPKTLAAILLRKYNNEIN